MGRTDPYFTGQTFTINYGTNTTGESWAIRPEDTSFLSHLTSRGHEEVPAVRRCAALDDVDQYDDGYVITYGCSLERGHDGDHRAHQEHNLKTRAVHIWPQQIVYGEDPFA